jgi:hypothetical protein
MKKAVSILVSAIALAVAAPASASTGLSGWWPFYEGTGTTAHDVSGNHKDGTLGGGAQWTSGYFGSALSFNGDGANVQVPDSAAFEPSTTLTVAAYVKATSPGDLKYIVAKGGFGCATGAYGLYTGPNGGVNFYVDHPDGVNFTLSPEASSGGVWDGSWHFVVGTYDGSAVHLYVDGAEIGSGTPYSGAIRYGGPTSNDVFIGHYEGCSGLDFPGAIDEPTVWNKALSAAQIRLAYQALTALHGWVSRLPSFPVN